MKEKLVSLGIKKIKEIEFVINEEINISDIIDINIGFELSTKFHKTEHLVEFVFTAIFTEKISENIFLKIKTINVFEIPELENFYKEKEDIYDLPDSLIVTMLSLSVTHTRALLAKNTIGTKFTDLYIPIVNPTELTKKLFGTK